MEKYKKKSLKFMGFSRDMRKTELDNQRCVSRLERFSSIRTIDDDNITEEKNVNKCRIPMIGKPKAQTDNRIELLKKWKQEKVMKQQQESKLRKPAFKVGATKSCPSPSIGNKPLFALDTSSRVFKSSFRVPNSQPSINIPSVATGNLKTNAKVPSYQSAIKPEVSADKLKTNAKDLKIQPFKSKIGMVSKPETKWTKNKESSIQSLNVKPKADTQVKVVNKDQLNGNKKQSTIASKPLETKKESRLQPLNARSKVPSTVKGVKSNTPLSGLPKPTISKTLSRDSDQIPSSGLPKPNISKTLSKDSDQNRIPKSSASKIHERNFKDKCNPEKNNVKGISKYTRSLPSQQKGYVADKESPSESEIPNKPVDDFATFECELSHIEPVEEKEKSFAPVGFMFQPPTDLSSFLFSDDGPSAIFLRMKNQFLRTSTPKRHSSLEKTDLECTEYEATKDIKNENAECLKNENVKCSTNADEELEHAEKPNLETILSSSLGSVSLNDLKSEDCLQTHKCEFPEVVLTQNQETSFSTKIIHPEHSLITEPTPILLNSFETDRGEVNSIDISPNGVITQSVQPVLEEKNKSEIDTIDTCLEDECKISVRSPNVDSVFVEDNKIPTENAKENESVSNGFIQNPENGAIKMPMKPRNFRQSEKPGLMSINESLENTPKSALKKKVLENSFTPRRSLRLAKLSGNFSSSLDNLLDHSETKVQDKTGPKENLTPRRSKRFSKCSVDFNSVDNLFDVQRPTLFSTPEEDKPKKKIYSKVTYDFDRLSIESDEETRPRFTNYGKPSLLPVSRPSIMRHSIKGDLMSFSPDV